MYGLGEKGGGGGGGGSGGFRGYVWGRNKRTERKFTDIYARDRIRETQRYLRKLSNSSSSGSGGSGRVLFPHREI
ncbi:hypothetical protein M0802_016127 [Mischocyttarus mexicanus]|nr:hypothetical protein M0802_016127 [Mischocyttarus mexicanus]